MPRKSKCFTIFYQLKNWPKKLRVKKKRKRNKKKAQFLKRADATVDRQLLGRERCAWITQRSEAWKRLQKTI